MEMTLVALLPVGLSVFGAGVLWARRRQRPPPRPGADQEVIDADDAFVEVERDPDATLAAKNIDGPLLPPPPPDEDEDAFESGAASAQLAPPPAPLDDDDVNASLQDAAEAFALLYAPVHDDDGRELTVSAAVAKADALVPLPSVVTELMALAARDDVDAAEIAAVVERDVSVAGALFRLANSSFFGYREETSDMVQAVARVGMANVRELVIGLSVAAAAAGDDEQTHRLCERMMAEAACGRVIAQHSGTVRGSDALVACMLRELGQVLLHLYLGECYATFASAARAAAIPLDLAETAWLGFHHAEVGAALAEAWGLPDTLCSSIRLHHDDDAAQSEGATVAHLVGVGHLAEITAAAVKAADPDGAPARVERAAQAMLGMPATEARSLLDDCRGAVFEMGVVFAL